jgi:hypothetical protein
VVRPAVQERMDRRTIALALVIGGVGCASAPSKMSSVVPSDRPGRRVHVGTSDTGDDADRRGRQQSVMDVQSTVARRHDHRVPVDSPAQAEIAVAIVERVVADSKSSRALSAQVLCAKEHRSTSRDGHLRRRIDGSGWVPGGGKTTLRLGVGR